MCAVLLLLLPSVLLARPPVVEGFVECNAVVAEEACVVVIGTPACQLAPTFFLGPSSQHLREAWNIKPKMRECGTAPPSAPLTV